MKNLGNKYKGFDVYKRPFTDSSISTWEIDFFSDVKVQEFYNALATFFKQQDINGISELLTNDFTATQLDSSRVNKIDFTNQLKTEFGRFKYTDVDFKIVSVKPTGPGYATVISVRRYATVSKDGSTINTEISTKDGIRVVGGKIKVQSQILTNKTYALNGKEFSIAVLSTTVAMLQGCCDDEPGWGD